MIIKPINCLNANILLDEIKTEGNSPIKIIGSDYKTYLAKNSKSKTPSTDIINEVLAYYFLNLWEIPTPNAVLIDINPINFDLSKYTYNHHKPVYYNIPVFGSEWIKNADDNTQKLLFKSKTILTKFSNHNDLLWISLFDLWVENEDRKDTNHNLIMDVSEDKYKFMAIDHAYILLSGAYDSLDPITYLPPGNDTLIVSNLVRSYVKCFKKSKNTFPDFEERFYICIENCRKNFNDIVKQIPKEWNFAEDSQNKIYNFLFNQERNKKVLIEFLFNIK